MCDGFMAINWIGNFAKLLNTHFALRMSVLPLYNALYFSQFILKRHYLIQLWKVKHFSVVTLKREGNKNRKAYGCLTNAITVDYKVRVFM